METLRKVKIKKEDGSITSPIPIGTEAENIDLKDGRNIETAINEIEECINQILKKIDILNVDNNNINNKIYELSLKVNK